MNTQVYFYAAVFTLMLVALSVNVIFMRGKVKVDIGTGSDARLERAVRAQGNFAEYVPMALLLMAMSAASGMAGWAIHLAGILLLAVRIAHAYSLLVHEPTHTGGSNQYIFRMIGQGGTFAVLVGLALYLLIMWMVG